MHIPFGYVKRFTLTLGRGIVPISPISTLTLLLVCAFLIMCVYFCDLFDNHYTDYMTIFMEIQFTIYVVCLIILAPQLPASMAFGLGAFVVVVALTFMLCLGWLVYLTVYDICTKGCWPSLKEEPHEQNAKDDYSDSKSEKMRKKQQKQKEDQRRRKLGLPVQSAKVAEGDLDNEHQREESANEFINRFQSKTDDLFSNKGINEDFKDWSDEQGSHKNQSQEEQIKKSGLPTLLYKKEIERGIDQ